MTTRTDSRYLDFSSAILAEPKAELGVDGVIDAISMSLSSIYDLKEDQQFESVSWM